MVFNQLKAVFEQLTDICDDFQPFIVNRFISFGNKKQLKFAEFLNKYTFVLDRQYQFKIYQSLITPQRTPYLKYIKAPKETAAEFDFLFEKIRVYYQMSDTDFQASLPIYLEMFKNKEILEKYMRFFGVDKKYFTKYKIKIDKKKVREGEKKNRWF